MYYFLSRKHVEAFTLNEKACVDDLALLGLEINILGHPERRNLIRRVPIVVAVLFLHVYVVQPVNDPVY